MYDRIIEEIEENGEDHTKLGTVSSQLKISPGRELNIGSGHIVAAWSCGGRVYYGE